MTNLGPSFPAEGPFFFDLFVESGWMEARNPQMSVYGPIIRSACLVPGGGFFACKPHNQVELQVMKPCNCLSSDIFNFVNLSISVPARYEAVFWRKTDIDPEWKRAG